MERSAEKRTLWKITPSARVKWEGRFCYKFTHPRLGESNNYFLNETVLLSCQDASENGILLQFPTIKKIVNNIEWFLCSCENYLFISQHQMHELIICDSLPSVCPQSTHCLKASRTFNLFVCLKKKKKCIVLICTGSS